jgi:hypothetical protein
MSCLVGAVLLGGLMLHAAWPDYRASRIDLVDSRLATRQWLERNTHGGDVVLVASELGFAPSELEHVPGRVLVRPLDERRGAATSADVDFVVVGDFPSTKPWRPAVYDREILTRFGQLPTLTHQWAYRRPKQIVRVFGGAATRDTSECEPLCG